MESTRERQQVRGSVRWFAGGRVSGAVGAMLIAMSVAAPADSALGRDAERLDATKEVVRTWVEQKRLIAQRKRQFALAKQMLSERIALVSREIDDLRTKIAKAEGDIAETDKEQTELEAENAKLKAASAGLSEAIVILERRTKTLLKRLPPPIVEKVKPLSQRIPDDPENTELSISHRFQNIAGILTQVNKFNTTITVTSEKRDLPGGEKAEVTVMYLGVGRAWYVGGGGAIGGYGSATEDRWAWTPANDAGPEIDRAVRVFRNEEMASFVKLPLDVE